MPEADNVHYLVCKMHVWEDFVVVIHGVDHRLWQPADSGIIGFIPVYDDHKLATAESNGLPIIALTVQVPTRMKEEPDGDDKEES